MDTLNSGSDGRSASELEQAARSGDAEAMMLLGQAYADGALGLRRDPKAAVRMFVRAADAGNPEALVSAGDLEVLQGRASKAADLYLRASSARVPLAESRLASMFMEREEYAFALDHAERGAVSGMQDCMLYLGRIYYYGLETEQDHMHALYWYSRCCRTFPEAMRCVGVIRMEKGQPYFDMYKGLAALRIAADGRDEEAKERLLELRLDAETAGLPDDYFDPPDIPQYVDPIIERMAKESEDRVPERTRSGFLSRFLGH